MFRPGVNALSFFLPAQDTPPIRHRCPKHQILILRHLPLLRVARARVHALSEYTPIYTSCGIVFRAQHPVPCLPILRRTAPIAVRA